MSATLPLAEQLIACRSVTPEDGGCQALLAARLEAIGFRCTALPFGPDTARVSNLWAIRRGTAADGNDVHRKPIASRRLARIAWQPPSSGVTDRQAISCSAR